MDPATFFESLFGKNSPGDLYNLAKFVFITLDVLLFIGLLFGFIKARGYRPKLHPHYAPSHAHLTMRNAMIRDQWDAIIQKTNFDLPESAKVAIIEADALVNNFLMQAGVQGEHMADRLDQLSQDFHTLNRIRRAHRLRNHLVHTAHYQVAPEDARGAVEDYAAFLTELGVL